MADHFGCLLCACSVRLWNFRTLNTSDIEGPGYYRVGHQVSIPPSIRYWYGKETDMKLPPIRSLAVSLSVLGTALGALTWATYSGFCASSIFYHFLFPKCWFGV